MNGSDCDEMEEPTPNHIGNGYANGEDSDTIEFTDEEVLDPFCNPDHPVEVNFNDVSAAAYKIKGGVERTPCNVSVLYKILQNLN